MPTTAQHTQQATSNAAGRTYSHAEIKDKLENEETWVYRAAMYLTDNNLWKESDRKIISSVVKMWEEDINSVSKSHIHLIRMKIREDEQRLINELWASQNLGQSKA